MIPDLILTPAEVNELEHVVEPWPDTPSFPGASEWIELRRAKAAALIADWRTLVAEIERLNRERESRQSFIDCLKTEIADWRRRLEASETELAALKNERERVVEKVREKKMAWSEHARVQSREFYQPWAGRVAAADEILTILEQYEEPPR